MPNDQQYRPTADEERQRLDALDTFGIAGLNDDPTLKAVTEFAANLCHAPICLVSIVEENRQWFPARAGLDVAETPRETSFCAHAMRGSEVMIVPDALHDPRFAENPLVLGEPGIRFYAGAPLVSADGVQIGALCVIDHEPRSGLTALQREGLAVLAGAIVTQLAQRRSERRQADELGEQESKFRILADTMPQMVWSTRPDGFHDYYNARWYEFTGVPAGSTDGEAWNGMFHPEDQDRAWAVWRHSLETGEPYEIEYRLRDARGEYRWTLGRALPMRDKNGAIIRWFGTCTDIHDQKMLQAQREIIAQELSHRIKNIFSVVNGLISFSTRQHPALADAAADLRGRILALGRAHDFVRPHSEESRPAQQADSLKGMLDSLLGAYAERVTISGDDIRIDDHSATPLALTFHELATNAAKYGALAQPDGTVTIASSTQGGQALITWTERGATSVAEPEAYGFGSKLIELSVIRQLGGAVERAWSPRGLQVRLQVPMSAMCRQPARGS